MAVMHESQKEPLRPYFFLSYARSDPLAADLHENPDHLVGQFFRDLNDAVQGLVKRTVSGFFDQLVPIGSDLKLSVTQAIGATQVFVPLYTVAYLTNSWPGREFACFTGRLERAGRANPARRLVPVLWAPLAGVADPPGLHDAPGVKAEPDYAENGLRALLKLKYDASYQSVVQQVARQIVDVAENEFIEPAEPSQVPDIENVSSAFSPSSPLAVFDIQVAAPTAATAPRGSDLSAYAETPSRWQPFPELELPLAESACQIAERFDFATLVSEVGHPTGRSRQPPGIVIIDPAFAAAEAGIDVLRSVARMPRWVLPLLVIGQPDDRRTRELADQVRTILKAEQLPTDSARKGARGVSSLDEFHSLVPVLVVEAERQYLRHRPSQVTSPRSTRRLRLGRSDDPDGPTAVDSGSLGKRNARRGSRAIGRRRSDRHVLLV
jgi:FxsC-like protein